MPGRPYSRGKDQLCFVIGVGEFVWLFYFSRVSLLSPSFWEKARCNMKYCLKVL